MIGFPRHGLYAIADTAWLHPGQLAEAVAAAIRGGASAVQLRDKSGLATADVRVLDDLLACCRAAGVPFLINDNPDLALRLGADGVHLGCEEADLPALRRRLGGMIIGVSCHARPAAAVAAAAAGADYVAFGRMYPSRTKPDAAAADLDVLRRARPRLRLPIVAIGGLTPDNSAPVLAAGADLLAVIEGIFGRPDPESAARRFQDLFAQLPSAPGR